MISRKKRSWINEDGSLIKKKKYKSYSDYITHQKSKLEKTQNYLQSEYDPKYRGALRDRLEKSGIIKSGMTVLCLAARLGTEVKSFLDLGCFAIGLDLNPGKDNRYVVSGDFHSIQFADNSVDLVFTNSLDHALDFEELIKEVKRVLKPNGRLILEIVRGEEEGVRASYWEAAAWKKIDDVIGLFVKSGFEVSNRTDFEYPWNGQHVLLTLKQ